jgi:hypothetical protein
MRRILLTVLLVAGCTDASTTDGVNPSNTGGMGGTPGDDASAPEDMAVPHTDDGGGHPGGDNGDGGISDAAPMHPPPSDGGAFLGDGGGDDPGGADTPVVHAPPTNITTTNLFGGLDILDVSVDQGGGVWAVTSSTVYYLPAGKTTPFTYDQKSGLARGQYQWTDTWFSPGTYPVTFQAVAGATPGQAVIGEIGTIGDRLEVNPSTGAVTRIDNMVVTMNQVQGSEFPEHVKRVVATWKAIVDLNGTFSGTAYVGGFHGFEAFHGINNDCGCLAFEEHQHYITADTVGGGDVKGLTFTSQGDIYQGDRDFVTLLLQRSSGPNTGLFDHDFTWGLDVFPNTRDEVIGLAADVGDGLYVASDGNGMAYLAPVTHAAQYWSTATTLPQNHLRGVAVDGNGDVWIATATAGMARFKPSSNQWIYYTAGSGLPSSTMHAVYYDRLTSSGKIYLATSNGVAVITP